MGGAGSAVNEYLHQAKICIPVLNLGIPDKYIHHAEREDQLNTCGLSHEKMIQSILQYQDT